MQVFRNLDGFPPKQSREGILSLYSSAKRLLLGLPRAPSSFRVLSEHLSCLHQGALEASQLEARRFPPPRETLHPLIAFGSLFCKRRVAPLRGEETLESPFWREAEKERRKHAASRAAAAAPRRARLTDGAHNTSTTSRSLPGETMASPQRRALSPTRAAPPLSVGGGSRAGAGAGFAGVGKENAGAFPARLGRLRARRRSHASRSPQPPFVACTSVGLRLPAQNKSH